MFPERSIGESHKSTYTAWPPAVPVQPCPRGEGCPATVASTPCSEPWEQPRGSHKPTTTSSAPREGSTTSAALLYQQPRLLGGSSQSCRRAGKVLPYGCRAGGPEPAHCGAAFPWATGPAHLQSQKIPPKIEISFSASAWGNKTVHAVPGKGALCPNTQEILLGTSQRQLNTDGEKNVWKMELQKREGLVPSQVSGRWAPPSCRSSGETSGKKQLHLR